MPRLTMPAFSPVSSLAPLVLRVAVGIVMALHGYLKLAGGPSQFAELLTKLGVPAPGPMAYVVILSELLGGVLLVLGLLTRVGGLLIVATLAVATILVKTKVGLIAPEGQGPGAELDIALLAGALALVLMGPGPLSLDRIIGLERSAPDTGAA